MIANMSVSVIIPTFNRAAFLRQALDSVLAQTVAPEQIIVVNDGSTDDTNEVLAQYENQVEAFHLENGGKARALNIAMCHVASSHIWILDDDDVALPTALENHHAALRSCQYDTFSYSPYFAFSGLGTPGNTADLPFHDAPVIEPDALYMRALRGFPFFQQSMVVPVALYEDAGPFDETLLRSQDRDMIIRLARIGHAVRVPHATFMLREHSGTRGPRQKSHTARGRGRVWAEYDVVIAEKALADTALSEYLGKSRAHKGPLTDEETMRALLTRATIEASSCLYGLALKDIEHALRMDVSSDQAISSAEPLRRLTDFGLGIVPRGTTAFYFRLSRLLASHRSPAANKVLRGLYWQMREQLKNRELAVAGWCAFFASLVAGPCYASVVLPPRQHRRGGASAPRDE